MRAILPALAVALALVPAIGAAQCPAGVVARDVAYTCPPSAPNLDFAGVCVPESTGYVCGTSCTVCFCGNTFSSRLPCPAQDSGPAPPYEPLPACGSVAPGRGASLVSLGLAVIATLAAARRGRRGGRAGR